MRVKPPSSYEIRNKYLEIEYNGREAYVKQQK